MYVCTPTTQHAIIFCYQHFNKKYSLSLDVSKEPDMCGIKSNNPIVTSEAFQELLSKTEKGFVCISFYVIDNSLRLIVNDIKNNPLVTINNLKIRSQDLIDLKETYKSHPHFSMGFAIFIYLNRQLLIYPISEKEVVLSIKSWEVLDF